jgi:phosphate-selective porin OprO/OprP
MKSAWCAVLAVAICSSAWARTPDGDDEKREGIKSASESTTQVETLSAELRAQRAELDAQRAQIEALKAQKAPVMSLEGAGEPPVQEKKDVTLTASFTDGFHMMTSDGNFDLHVGGRMLEEYRYVTDRPIGPAAGLAAGATARTQPDSFYAREMFLSIDGTLYHDWGFKINGDFATDQVARLEEGFMEWKHFKEFRLQFGQFKVAQSYEYMGSPRFLEEIQRTAMSRWNPGIELGIMATGSVVDGRFNYWLGVSNGRGHLNNNGRSVADDNDNKEFQVKLAISPWAPDKESFLQKFRIGGYFARDIAGMATPGHAAPGGPVTLGNVNTNELGTTWITFGAPSAAVAGPMGDHTRYGAELLYAYGPFGFRAEAQMRKDRFQNTTETIDEKLPIKGYYLTATYLLTGEDKTVSARVNPSHNLDFEGGWGAVELVARYAACSIDEGKLTTLGIATNTGQNSNRVSVLTAGVNWWTTKNTRISVDYVAENYHDPLAFEASKNRAQLGGILARFQIDF